MLAENSRKICSTSSKTYREMTKYLTLDKTKIEGKKTKFEGLIDYNLNKDVCGNQPENYDNVLYLGKGGYGYDLFKAWSSDKEDSFFIYYGVKGDEFNV